MLGTAPGSGATGVTLPPEPLAEYERVPVPTATADQLQAVVERHGLELDGPITPISSAGVVHALWRLGSQWVLRVPKNEAMCLGDHRCEAIAIRDNLCSELRCRNNAVPAVRSINDLPDRIYILMERGNILLKGRGLFG